MGRAALLLCIAMLLCAAAAAAAVRHPRYTAHAGAFRAQLTYDVTTAPDGFERFSHLRVQASRLGHRLLSATVVSRAAGAELRPFGIALRDLDGDGTPELVLQVFTGGAHCCFVGQVFDLTARPPRKVEWDFGDPGFVIKRADGATLVWTGDDSFAYAFTDYADSALPLELLAYRGKRLVDVTREHPKLVAADAASLWRGFRRDVKTKSDVRGVLAAWAADEAALGRADEAHARLLALSRTSVLQTGVGAPKGGAYVRTLWHFLAHRGYLR